MENIEGETLLDTWPTLTVTQRELICAILKGYIDALRCLASPGYYGSIGKRPLLDGIFTTSGNLPTISGPFTTEEEVNEAMVQKYLYYDRPPYKANFYRRSFPTIFKGHPPVFTHGDFQRKNIIVKKLNDTSRSTTESNDFTCDHHWLGARGMVSSLLGICNHHVFRELEWWMDGLDSKVLRAALSKRVCVDAAIPSWTVVLMEPPWSARFGNVRFRRWLLPLVYNPYYLEWPGCWGSA